MISIDKILEDNLPDSMSRILDTLPDSKANIKDAMLEFGKQLLQMAAESASIILYIDNIKESSIKEHCTHRNNMEYLYINDKQSILDTINQVK